MKSNLSGRIFDSGDLTVKAGVKQSPSMVDKPLYQFKLVILGDASVGKSCLAGRFVKGSFVEFQESTIGAAFMTKTIELDDCFVKYEIWDTAGQERYRTLAPMYYRGSSAAVIVYDVTVKESLVQAKGWIKELMSHVDSNKIIMAMAANKIDLVSSDVEQPQQQQQQALEFCQANNCIFYETSAKTGQNVSELFTEIAKQIPKGKLTIDFDQGFKLQASPSSFRSSALAYIDKKCCTTS